MNVKLIAYTKPMNGESPMAVCEHAASICYDSIPTESFKIAKRCVKSGHMSILEHISFTFHVTDVSRALLAQLSRHRHISLSVRSQRYCDERIFSAVYPDSIKNTGRSALDLYDRALNAVDSIYGQLKDKGVPAEDARMVLPNACSTELYMTANARSLIEMSRLRLCKRSQWEIRELFEAMKSAVEQVCPEVAEAMRPKCEIDPAHPFCTEAKSCGRHLELGAVYRPVKGGVGVKNAEKIQ